MNFLKRSDLWKSIFLGCYLLLLAMSKWWSVFWFKGILLLLENFSFSIDPYSRIAEGDFILISHAHGDHISGFKSSKPKLASYITIKLYEAQTGRKLRDVFPAFLSSQRFNIGGLDVEIHDSGHILGSSQFLFVKHSSSLVYTGDLNLERTIITEPGRPIECDELIIDSTYGRQDLVFPRREDVYIEIVNWVESLLNSGNAPVFIAYSIGKAQELIALLNDWLELEVLIDDRIGRVNRVYESYGFNFNCLSLSTREGHEALRSKSLPAVFSSRETFKLAERFGFLKAIATGWTLIYPYRNFHACFPLSSHADFSQLVSYIEEAKPKIVYAFGFHAEGFARWIKRNMGVESIALVD